MKTQVVPKTSLVRRLKTILFVLAFFFLASVAATLFSSKGALEGLAEVNLANTLLGITTQVTEGLAVSSENAGKLLVRKDLSDVRFVWRASQEQVKQGLVSALSLAREHPDLYEHFLRAQNAVKQYEFALEGVFEAATPAQAESKFLIAGQFELDAREAIRKAQIQLEKLGDSAFQSVYRMRFQPLLVLVALTLLSLTFVVLVGRGFARSLESSLSNLLSVTRGVTEGNLALRAEVLSDDELGKLTASFNRMVGNLEEGQAALQSALERTSRLQLITAALSEASRPEEVWEVGVLQGMEAMRADAGALLVLSEDGLNLEIKRIEGHQEESYRDWMSFPITAEVPASEAFRKQMSIFLESREEIRRLYPHLASSRFRAAVFLPLIVRGRAFGVMSLSFLEDRPLSVDDREYMQAFASQCAQALHRAQLYEDAQRAVQARDEFLSIASHELKTPLTPLKLQLQNLLRSTKNGEIPLSQKEIVKIAESSDRQIGRLAALVEDLLDVSRISSGRLGLKREVLDLSTLVSELVSRHREQFASSGSSIQVEAPSALIGSFDRLRVEQVLTNLFTNAVKYAPGKPIRVSVSMRGDQAQIVVRDEGPGVAREDQLRIFGRFERVKTRNNVGGLGLGLYICKQIVEAHGGKIFVESEPGRGASFIVLLPVRSQPVSLRSVGGAPV